ncbi:MAG: tetratricopeptide repeat protein [Candidatus Aminicenantes bacterium]|nr:MAG: tetratricopeptide repeat protein [Candidatus Aminicenantes bacterium]
MKEWKITGLIASIVIVLIIPLYVLKVKYVDRLELRDNREPIVTFVGRERCIGCHKREYDQWQGSHHDKAMDEANEHTVLGDFNDAVFAHRGVTTRFYRKGKKFFVYTRGSKGKMDEFEITYTFGVTPLQQYLVPFPGGGLQCLPYAWDVKEKRWYHLYPDENIQPDDWLYWTNAGQNWNGMCAECHSTNLEKGYDPETGVYCTTWSGIDVSCEACHGPGSRHVEWAELPGMARSREVENFGLVVRTGSMDATDQVRLCARCHSRRTQLGDYNHGGKDMMDNLVPELLNESTYFSDGQILDEVYVYGSFVQSKMYRNNVRCSDCHDIHSLKPVKQGNDLCLQCHRGDTYNTKDHHFHKQKGEEGEAIYADNGKKRIEVGEGAECVKCHMPGRYYMGIDYRPDHSIRVPGPDLTGKLSVPNACNRCHRDKSVKWAADQFTQWYGISRKPHYGTILAAGRRRIPGARGELIKLANDPLYPVLVRATALTLLSAYPGEDSTLAFKRALDDPEALIRHTAVRYLNPLASAERIRLIVPLLNDPVKAVRIEAAMNLTAVPAGQLNARQAKAFRDALLEYQKTMEYSADLPFARFNLGNMYANIGQLERAIENYKMAIQLDKDYYPAKINLAMLYNRLGKNSQTESLLRDVLNTHPQFYEAAYSLGLLLAEKKQFAEAAEYLEKAAKGLPEQARIHYNLGLLLQYLKRPEEAEAALLRTLEIEPDNMDYLYAAAGLYIKAGKLRKAKQIVEQMVSSHPANSIGPDLLNFINSKLQARAQRQGFSYRGANKIKIK